MVKADELAVCVLPESRLDEFVLHIVPLAEVVVNQSAGIGGILVEAPEGVVDVLVDHVVADFLEPVTVFAGLVVLVIDPAAPLAHEQGIHILLYEICPGVVPVILQEGLAVEGLGIILQIEPVLCPDLGAVVMRGIDDLLGVFANIHRMLLDAAEVGTPPCAENLGRLAVVRIINRRC